MSKLVLIVDNVTAIRETLKDAILQLNAERVREGQLRVETAPGADAAVTLCGAAQPDLILMDVDMPEKDGVEAFYALKERHPTSAGRVMFLTGMAGAETVGKRIERAIADGALGFLPKPAGAADLQGVIDRHLFQT